MPLLGTPSRLAFTDFVLSLTGLCDLSLSGGCGKNNMLQTIFPCCFRSNAHGRAGWCAEAQFTAKVSMVVDFANNRCDFDSGVFAFAIIQPVKVLPRMRLAPWFCSQSISTVNASPARNYAAR